MRISGYELRVGLWPGEPTSEPTSVPLLIFNGIGSRLELLDPFVQWLDPDRKVIFFDVPGTTIVQTEIDHHLGILLGKGRNEWSHVTFAKRKRRIESKEAGRIHSL
jgi:hypothetical protein